MTQEFSETLPLYRLKMELFTFYHRISGEVTTNALRTFGVLNTGESFLLLSKVSTHSLTRTQNSPVESAYARVLKEAVVLAVPNEEPENEHRFKITRIFNRGELLQRQVLLVLGNYEISGNLHLEEELDMQKVLLERAETFIGVTNASLVYLPNPALKFAASTILINKHKVDFICAGTP